MFCAVPLPRMPFHPSQPSQDMLFILQILAEFSCPLRSLTWDIQAELSSLSFASQIYLEHIFIDTLTSEHCVCIRLSPLWESKVDCCKTPEHIVVIRLYVCRAGPGSHSCLYLQPAPKLSINFHAGQHSSEQVPILMILMLW